MISRLSDMSTETESEVTSLQCDLQHYPRPAYPSLDRIPLDQNNTPLHSLQVQRTEMERALAHHPSGLLFFEVPT